MTIRDELLGKGTTSKPWFTKIIQWFKKQRNKHKSKAYWKRVKEIYNLYDDPLEYR